MSAPGTKRTLAESGFVRSERPLHPRSRHSSGVFTTVRFRPKAAISETGTVYIVSVDIIMDDKFFYT